MNKNLLVFRYSFTIIFLLFAHFLQAQIITTVAGGSIGDGKPAVSIGIVETRGFVADNANNLYILDNTNRRVRKVDAGTGIITTVAGNGTYTSTGNGGPAVNAGLFMPEAIAIDALGNIYISELNRI